jgi:putative hydrolase of the HAD superfamily
MHKKALIFDLDNTLYAVSSIAGTLFAPLFGLLAESGELNGRLEPVKQDLMRKPYQWVAQKHGFSKDLTEKGLHLLQNATYEGKIEPFPDYDETRQLPLEKFLVTSGFQAMQQSKIKGMGIDQDFKEIHIVDVETATKKDVFADIIKRNGYAVSDILVIGDDPESEIKAANELGIDAVLYDKLNRFPHLQGLPKISDYKHLAVFL